MGKCILIADDHKITQIGLKFLCESIFNEPLVFILCDNMEDLIKSYKSDTKIDLAILDNFLINEKAVHSIEFLKLKRPDTPILFLSMANEETYGMIAFKGGAQGFINKTISDNELCFAIKKVMNGGLFFSDNILRTTSKIFDRQNENPFSILSPNEFKIAIYLLQGLKTKKICEILGLSASTISTYKHRIFEKLGTNNIIDLITLAHSYGIIDEKLANN